MNSCDGWIGLGSWYEPMLDGVSISSEWAYSDKKGDVYEGVFGRGLVFSLVKEGRSRVH